MVEGSPRGPRPHPLPSQPPALSPQSPASREDMPAHLQRSRRPELSPKTPVSILHTGRRTFGILLRHNL